MEKALEREKQNRAQIENAAKGKEAAVGRQDSQTDAGLEALKPDLQWTTADGLLAGYVWMWY